jgi:transcriptional regulator of stress and heat shock response
MRNLAELIEQYLRGILTQNNMVELQRRELAKIFRCAPSQINYVLETRFTLDRGFIVESKRGGGGYIRITQVKWQSAANLPQLVKELVPESLNQSETEVLLSGLVQKELIGAEAAQLALQLMVNDFRDLPAEYADYLRSKFLKALLLVLGSREQE